MLSSIAPGALLTGLPAFAAMVPEHPDAAPHTDHPVLALCVAGAVLTGGIVVETVRHHRKRRVIEPRQLTPKPRPYLRVQVLTPERKRSNDRTHAAVLAAHRP
ncbi:MAG TPA: hypothetical protein VE172_00590 [Stackebrandtia sp.]|uniref:hypothetical protein n=1 Tax=Stackebrandtia sp. TaxID=2023065 RepID=UPI002D41D8D4|nr:hypothetical protein [Stackebrandtia sp.]HZE37286.1 hypothetical protein [Stackebrandtia sp.]